MGVPEPSSGQETEADRRSAHQSSLHTAAQVAIPPYSRDLAHRWSPWPTRTSADAASGSEALQAPDGMVRFRVGRPPIPPALADLPADVLYGFRYAAYHVQHIVVSADGFDVKGYRDQARRRVHSSQMHSNTSHVCAVESSTFLSVEAKYEKAKRRICLECSGCRRSMRCSLMYDLRVMRYIDSYRNSFVMLCNLREAEERVRFAFMLAEPKGGRISSSSLRGSLEGTHWSFQLGQESRVTRYST